MDTIDNFDSGEEISAGGESMQNSSPEQREKQKEKSSKALAGIKASRRDESRAKKQDDLFVKLLSELLHKSEDPRVLDEVLYLLNHHVPTTFLVMCCMLGFPWALSMSQESLHIAGKITFPRKGIERGIFRDDQLTQEEKTYLHTWIDISFQVFTENPSEIMTHRLLTQLRGGEREHLERGLRFFFEYFITEIGFTPAKDATQPFVRYLLSQIEKRLADLQFSDSILRDK